MFGGVSSSSRLRNLQSPAIPIYESSAALILRRKIKNYFSILHACERTLLQLCLFASCKTFSYIWRPGLRGYPCGKHVIFYRVLSQTKVRIARILHEMMDFPRHL